LNKKIILPRLDIEILNLKSKALSNRIQRYIDSHKKVICRGNLVSVHIVEFSNGKDKKLKLMSTFWKENKKT